MKLLVVLLLASHCALAADKSVLELQRDMALLGDEVKSLDQRLDAIETLLKQLSEQGAGNAAKSDARIDKLQTSVDQSLRSQADRLTAPIAGIGAKMDSVASAVSSLADAAGETTKKLITLQTQMNDMNNVLKALETAPALPPATKMFVDALGDMNGKPDMALKEFQDYLSLFPADPQTPHAMLKIGEIHYGQGAYEQAAQDFDAVIQKGPDSPYAADAMYMKGLALFKAGKRADASAAFKELIEKLPQSSQASQAKDQLRTLGPVRSAPARKAQ